MFSTSSSHSDSASTRSVGIVGALPVIDNLYEIGQIISFNGKSYRIKSVSEYVHPVRVPLWEAEPTDEDENSVQPPLLTRQNAYSSEEDVVTPEKPKRKPRVPSAPRKPIGRSLLAPIPEGGEPRSLDHFRSSAIAMLKRTRDSNEDDFSLQETKVKEEVKPKAKRQRKKKEEKLDPFVLAIEETMKRQEQLEEVLKSRKPLPVKKPRKVVPTHLNSPAKHIPSPPLSAKTSFEELSDEDDALSGDVGQIFTQAHDNSFC